MGEHNHDHECGCGCNHDHEHEYVTLTLDDGTEMNCVVLCIFPVADKDYIALLPEENMEDEDGEVFLYRFIESENGEPELLNLTTMMNSKQLQMLSMNY